MKKYLIIIFFFLFFTNTFADTKIAFIDVNFIIKNSIAGESLNKYISSFQNEHNKKFNEIEKSLIDKEKKLISKKNILEKSEFEKKLEVLNNEIKNYRVERSKSNENINNIRINSTKKILVYLNPIIAKYVEDNSISIVLPKKSIIVGKKKLDITNKIITMLNEKVKVIDF